MGLWTSIVYSSASDINRERMYGTLENIFVAPTSFAVILMGKIVGNTIWGFLSMILAFVYLTIVFQMEMPTVNIVLVLCALLAVIISISVFAFVMALFFTLSKKAEALMNFMEYPIFLVCGFLFPITILPIWLQPVSYILPPTYAIELLRKVTNGESSISEINVDFLLLGAVTLIYVVIGRVAYKAVDHKARIDGKLGVY